MNQIQIFNFHSNEVRTATDPNGDIYFCLVDVANTLEISRSSDLLQIQKGFVKNESPKNRGTLDPKGVVKLYTPTKGGTQELAFISEPNLYRVIFRSNKEQARQFQDWVVNEVLPTIRKTGAYVSESQQPSQPIGETEDKLRTIILALEHTTLSDVARETAIITSAETLTGVSIGYRPQIEQTTYSAKELGDVLGISANRVGRIANAHGLKTKEYGLYYLNKSQPSDKQVEHFRYFEKAIDKFKTILEND